MGKFYMVTATKVTTVLVEVADDQNHHDAMNAVADEYLGSDVDVDLDASPMRKDTDAYRRAVRHADEVILLPSPTA